MNEEIIFGGGMFALAGTMFLIALFLILAIYIFTSWALMSIASKTKTENKWMAWIPILNVYLMTQIGKQHWGWALAVVLLPRFS
ncbi:MAG: hypothetical protein ACQER9_03505 [Nanobdellota archaeon]